MKKFAVLLIALLTIVAVTDTFAQKSKRGAYKSGDQFIGGEVGLCVPMGDFGDVANIGFGLNGVFNYYLNSDMFLGAMIGYYTYTTDVDGWSFSNIPIVGGFYYHLTTDGTFRTFIGGEIGINFVSTEVETITGYNMMTGEYTYGTISSSDSKVSIAPCVGAVIPMSPKMEFVPKLRYTIMDGADSFVISAGLRWFM